MLQRMTLSAVATIFLAGCLFLPTQPAGQQKAPAEEPDPVTAPMLLELRRTGEPTDGSLNSLDIEVRELTLRRGGQEVQNLTYSVGPKPVYRARHYPEHAVAVSAYDGARLLVPALRAEFWTQDGTHSAPIGLTSPRIIDLPLTVTAGKRTKLVATFDMSKLTTGAGGYVLPDDGLTLQAVQQDLTSPDGFKVAYIGHFGAFRFDTGVFTLEGDDIDFSQMDMRVGPFGTEGGPVFRMENVSDGQGIVDLGERKLSEVTALPATGYEEQAAILPGHSYGVITKSGQRAKIRVYDFPASWMDWMGIEVQNF